MIRMVLVLTGFTLLLLGGLFLAESQQWISGYPSFTIEILVFLLIGTLVIFRYLVRVDSPELFVRLYLFMMALKLLAFGAFVLAIILLDRAGAKGNIVFFMITYLLFTGLEVAILYRKITDRNSTE